MHQITFICCDSNISNVGLQKMHCRGEKNNQITTHLARYIKVLFFHGSQ